MPMPENPYAPDKGQQLAMLLMSLGGGISQAANSGQGGFAGVGPGFSNFAGAMGMQQQRAMQLQQQQEAASLRERQFGLQESELRDKQAERAARLKGMSSWADVNDPSKIPGMGVPPTRPTIGGYDARTASLEGGSKNGGMVYNELGSGAGGPYQIMPATWADIRANNPDLNLPEVMPVDNRPETRAMHDAAHARFKAGNAQALQTAGIQPTPENLYLAHRFGAGGATSMLRAGDDKMLADVLPIDWQRQNPDMRGQTVGGFKRLAGERMQGVGQPYQASGETTQYAMQPSALPPFVGAGAGLIQPGAAAPGDITMRAPVMPQPQMPGQSAPQAAPNIPPAAPGAATSQTAPPPAMPPQVPKPMLTAQEYASIRAVAQTPKEAEDLKNKLINEKWARDQSAADKAWNLANENERFNRGQTAEQQRHERDLKEKIAARGDVKATEEQKISAAQKVETFKAAATLRDDFNNIQPVKDYRKAETVFRSAVEASQTDSAAADLNMVYAFATLMDPGSVVRDQETGMVIATQNASDRVKGLIATVSGGSRLSPASREALLNEMGSRYDSYKTAHDHLATVFGGIAKRSGLDPEDVVISSPGLNWKRGERAPGGYAANAPTNEELQSKSGDRPAPIRIDLGGRPKK